LSPLASPSYLFSLTLPRPPRSPLFPYTTLFRSRYSHNVRTPQQILAEAATIAVVGASSNPDKPAHGVPAQLQRHGWRIIPVNPTDRKSTRLNSSHVKISYAVFCLKKKKKDKKNN